VQGISHVLAWLLLMTAGPSHAVPQVFHVLLVLAVLCKLFLQEPEEEPQPTMHRMSKEASRTLMHRQRSFARDLQGAMGYV
jgi:hypothetical protein